MFESAIEIGHRICKQTIYNLFNAKYELRVMGVKKYRTPIQTINDGDELLFRVLIRQCERYGDVELHAFKDGVHKGVLVFDFYRRGLDCITSFGGELWDYVPDEVKKFEEDNQPKIPEGWR